MNAEQLTELFEPVIASLGLECLGVEFVASRGNGLVRVYIDVQDRHVTVEDCEAVSREISGILDVNDPISGRYTLEVSSPGFDRPLFKPEQFARFIGEQAKVSVNLAVGGRRRFQGSIVRVEGEHIVLSQDGSEVAIAHSNIEKAKLVPDFSDIDPAPKPSGAKPGKSKKKS
ncbi:MAG: ribosome maturation factor RimP [Xanthomonadales bacterium]|nr:ribosome maturation factor RimP [Xanthomonadales bacterium]MBK7145543.1 ribosome maturation factor RimP [Xanthomonadales bacterium]